MALLSRTDRRGAKDGPFNASLRRHYPHQVRRVCSHPARQISWSGPLRCSRKVTPSLRAWQEQSIARTYGERKPDTVALAFATIARVPRQGPDQFQAETAHWLPSNENCCIHGSIFAE